MVGKEDSAGTRTRHDIGIQVSVDLRWMDVCILFFFFFNDTATTEIYTLSLHDALPICFLRASELTRDRVEDARTVLKVDDEVEAKFIGVDQIGRAHV